MNCAICKELGVWSQRFGMILCNACKRRMQRADEGIQNPKAEAIQWLRQYKEKARTSRA